MYERHVFLGGFVSCYAWLYGKHLILQGTEQYLFNTSSSLTQQMCDSSFSHDCCFPVFSVCDYSPRPVVSNHNHSVTEALLELCCSGSPQGELQAPHAGPVKCLLRAITPIHGAGFWHILGYVSEWKKDNNMENMAKTLGRHCWWVSIDQIARDPPWHDKSQIQSQTLSMF